MRLGLELHTNVLDRLPLGPKIALAAACTQRQAEVFRLYTTRTATKNSDIFDRILNSIWQDGQLSHRQLAEYEVIGKALMPGQKRIHFSIYQANAECAVISLLRCIRVRMSGQTVDVILAAAQAFDSIDHFLTSPIGKTPEVDIAKPGANALVSAHPLMLAEQRRQEMDLLELQRADPKHIAAAIDELRKRAVGDERYFLPVIEEPPRLEGKA
jgi:hypothetical protein